MNPNPPPMDPEYISLILALCALLTKELARLQALVDVLETKGVVSMTEIDQAIAAIPPESMDAVSKRIQEDLKQLIAFYYPQLLPKPAEPIQ